MNRGGGEILGGEDIKDLWGDEGQSKTQVGGGDLFLNNSQ